MKRGGKVKWDTANTNKSQSENNDKQINSKDKQFEKEVK